MKIFSNHAGTTSESFKIGKHGFEVIRGKTHPSHHPHFVPLGSIYVHQDAGEVYIRTAHGWDQVVTHNSLVYFTVSATSMMERMTKFFIMMMAVISFFAVLLIGTIVFLIFRVPR